MQPIGQTSMQINHAKAQHRNNVWSVQNHAYTQVHLNPHEMGWIRVKNKLIFHPNFS